MNRKYTISVILLVTICILCNSTIKAQEKINHNINEIINEYDPILSTIQYYYRTWLEFEGQTYFGNEDLLSPSNLNDLNYIDDNISHLLNSIDTVKSYLHDLAYVSAEYGHKLRLTISDSKGQIEFQSKWREYQEGVTRIMAYDIEIIVQYLNVFYFLRDNQSKFEVEDDMIYFLDEKSLGEYNQLLNIIIDEKIEAEQEALRVKTMRVFVDAINLVKNTNK